MRSLRDNGAAVELDDIRSIINRADDLAQSGESMRADELYTQAIERARKLNQPDLAALAGLSRVQLMHNEGDAVAMRNAGLVTVEIAESAHNPAARELGARAAFLLGQSSQELGNDSDTREWMLRAEVLGRASESPDGLLVAAAARQFRDPLESGDWQTARASADDIINLARSSKSAAGLQMAAAAALAAGARAWDVSEVEVCETYLQLAAELGGESGTASGLETVARSDYFRTKVADSSAYPRQYRKVLRQVISSAARIQTRSAFELAALGSFDLAVHDQNHGRSRRARRALRATCIFGTLSGTPTGLQQTAMARLQLAIRGHGPRPSVFRGKRHRRKNEEGGYREAIALGRQSGTPPALEAAATAANRLGVLLATLHRHSDSSEAHKEAMELGSALGTSSALQTAAVATANLARNHLRAGRVGEARKAYKKGLKLAKASETEEGERTRVRIERALERIIKEEEECKSPIRKGIVVVHGMGEPRRNDFLSKTVNQVADWLERNVEVLGTLQAPRLDLNLKKEDRSFATITHGGRQWVFTEAFWAPRVETPLFNPTVGWVVNRFLRHLVRLCKTALHKSLLPAFVAAVDLVASLLYALLSLPFLIVILPLTPSLLTFSRFLLNQLYVLAVQATPDLEDPHEQQRVIQAAIGRWRRVGHWVVAALLPVAVLGIGLLALLFVMDPIMWQWTVLAYLTAMTLALMWQIVSCQTDLEHNQTTLSIYEAQGVVLTKHGYLQYRLPRLSANEVYRDALHNALMAVPLAATRGARRWLRTNDEAALLRYLDWQDFHRDSGSRMALRGTITLLVFFGILNSVFAVLLYALGAALIFPLLFLLWVLSAFSVIPGIPRVVVFFKEKLDAFLLGSLGDIKMYLEEVVQAANARSEVEDAIDSLSDKCDEVVVIAHSLGSVIAYETLVQIGNKARAERVSCLVTMGGILPMAWRAGSRRPTLDAPLPANVRWVNLWARFDPADSGPISPSRLQAVKPDWEQRPGDTAGHLLTVQALPEPERGGFREVIVSNEDDLLRDHTSYLENEHEVTPSLVREIWGVGSSEATGNFEQQEGLRALRRKYQILALSGPRLAAWYSLPISFFMLLSQMNREANLLKFKPIRVEDLKELINGWGLGSVTEWPILGQLVADPVTQGGCLLIALLGAVSILVIAQLLYAFLRSVLWNGFFKDLPMFSPTVPAPDPESRIAWMADGPGVVLGIAGGERFRR